MALNISGSDFSGFINSAQQSFFRAAERVGSGQRINSAADDAAGFAISTRLGVQVTGFSQASRNASDGISLAQTAGGDLANISENIQRIRELAIQAANGTLGDSDRSTINAEALQLQDEIIRVVGNSNFNGVPLLSSQDDIGIQVGPDTGDQVAIKTSNIEESLDSSGFTGVDLSTAEGAAEALAALDQLQTDVLGAATEFGASINRFQSTISNLDNSRVNAEASRSRIQDADIAREVSELSRSQVLGEVGIALQVQANQQSAFVLNLLN